MVTAKSNMFGRTPIYTSETEINENNIQSIIEKAMATHEKNREEIKYLVEYEKGNQPILSRTKEVRSEINEKVVENHASQIVNFKTAFVYSSPIRYVQKYEKETGHEDSPDKDDLYITELNEMCFYENKHIKDQELAKNFLTCGVGYKSAFANKNDEYSPFRITIHDPMCTFIIKSADVFHEPKIAVSYWTENKDKEITVTHYTAYTDDYVYEFTDRFSKVKKTKNGIGIIPIVEYRQDYAYMGCFERVLGLLDAINVCTSDRVNGLAQFVQSFLWFDNVDIDDDEFTALKSAGAFSTSSKEGHQANVKLIESSLNQTEIQSLSDYLYAQLLQICSMPSREMQSGSTTGQSSMLSGGWQEAEEDAQRLIEMFEEGERKFLNVIKHILDRSNTNIKSEIRLRDIDIKFSRNKVSNMLVKTQGMLNMKTFGIHPRIAIQVSDLFGDAQQTYLDSKEYLDKAYQTNSQNNNKDELGMQQNEKGNDPATVKESQNDQMSFQNQG